MAEKKAEKEKTSRSKIKKVKDLLDKHSSTKLHDFMVDEIKRFLELTTTKYLKIQDQLSREEILKMISEYEVISHDITNLTSCIAYWAKPEHKQVLQKTVTKMTDKLKQPDSTQIALQWYPAILQIYCAGIAATDGQRYDSLSNIFYARTLHSVTRRNHAFQVDSIASAIKTINQSKLFNNFEEFKGHYFAMSEHLYSFLRQTLEDLIFVGDYEVAFDDFEVLLNLVIIDRNTNDKIDVYPPSGRFTWKHQRDDNPPLKRIIKEAKAEEKNWEPLKHGFFRGDYERFMEIAEKYDQELNNDSRFW